MSQTPSVTAIVPMRHSSERVKGKNYRDFGGKPLFQHIVETLLAVPTIGLVVIDTDSPQIREYASEHLPAVRVLERPEHLRDGAIAMNVVLDNTVQQLDGELFLQTHSTNPFVRPGTLAAAIERFLEQDIDSLFSVTAEHARYWWDADHPVNHDPSVLQRTQDLPPLYLENSCFYIFKRRAFLSEGNRLTSRRALFPMSPLEALDIDTEDDWNLAVAMLSTGTVGS